MNASKDAEPRWNALAIGVWENEGGARAPDVLDHQYGGKIETDRFPPLHRVFTGLEAPVNSGTVTAFCRSGVTHSLLTLNQHHVQPGKERSGLSSPVPMPLEVACQP